MKRSSFLPHARNPQTCSAPVATLRNARIVSGRLPGLLATLVVVAAAPALSSQATAGEAIDFRRQRVLNQTLLRNTETELLLQRFAAHAASGRHVEAIELYQGILDHDADAFVWQQGCILPASTVAHREFAAHPALQPVYERLHGSTAARLLEEGSPAAYRDVARRFSQTHAGQVALERLIQLAWDQGDLPAACNLWQRLLHQPDRAAGFSLRKLHQIWTAAYATGNVALQRTVEKQPHWRDMSEQEIATVATLRQPASNKKDEEEKRGEAEKKPQAWPRSGLAIHWEAPRQPVVSSSRRYSAPLQEPVWFETREAFSRTGELSEETTVRLQGALEQWSRLQHEQLTPEVTTLFAVAVGETLVYRDLGGVTAVRCNSTNVSSDRISGERRLWRYPSRSPLAQALMYERDPYTGASTNHPGIDRLYLANSVSNALTTDGQRVFLVDGLSRHDLHVVRTVSHEQESASVQNERDDQDEADARLVNRLTALPLESGVSEAGIAWQIGVEGWRLSDHAPEPHELSGHFFLGPPTVENGLAFVISEHNQYAYLSALDATTGRCEWSQPISVVDRSIERDVVRATSACIAAYSDGMVLCDTGNGQLVAVDAHLGALRWTYGYADEDARQDSGRWTYTQSTRVTQPGVLNTPIVVGQHVLLLPERSSYLHCCDLNTGELLWTRKREGLEYLAAINVSDPTAADAKKRVLGVGDRFCMALNVADGSKVWETATRCISGHGIQVGEQFLLPVSDPQRTLAASDSGAATCGQILVLDVATGERRGYSAIEGYSGDARIRSRAENIVGHAFPLGNLLASEEMVFAVGVNQIVGFPQAGAVIRNLKQAQKSRPLTETDYQQFARAELALGNLKEAKDYLRTAIRPAAKNSSVRQQSVAMYRELLYEELLGRSNSSVVSRDESILNELHDLAESPVQQVRYLMTELELGVQSGDLRDLPNVLNQLAEKGLAIPVNSKSEVGHVATSDSWMPGLYHRICAQMSNTEQQKLLSELEQAWLNELPDRSAQQLTTLLQSLSCPGRSADEEFDTEAGECAIDPYAYDLRPAEATLFVLRDMLQIELIHRAVAAERWQEAELRLLRLKRSEDRVGQAYATQMLASLWGHLGLERQALSCLDELSRKAGGYPNYTTLAQWERYRGSIEIEQDNRLAALSPQDGLFMPGIGSTEEDFLTHFSQQHPFWNAWLDKQAPPARVTSVSVGHERHSVPEMDDPYRRKRLLHLLPEEDWMVLQQLEKLPAEVSASEGQNDADDEQHLLLLDRSTGSILHRIALPGSRTSVSQATSKQAGHLLPVVVSGRILGISLLEGRPLWERAANDLQSISAEDASDWTADEGGIVRSDLNTRERRHVPRVELGPVGVDFCIAQTSRALVCLDPLDGRLLWRRSDLDPQGGLWSDREVGILGDEHAILYFHPDQNHYTLLDTRSGRVLRRGALSNGSVQVQRTRQPFGRNLMFLSVSNDEERERRIRLWDPLTDEFLIDEPFGVTALYHHSEQDLAILSDNQLRIYRPDEGRMLVDLDLTGQDLPRANYLRISTIGDRYLVNLYQTRRTEEEDGYSSRFTDNPWDMTHLNGLVMAIDRDSGDLQWTRHLPHRSLVNADQAGLPFLLTCANFQTQPGAPSRQLLLELIDPATGETITRITDLPSARLLMLEHDADQQKLTLEGLTDEVTIRYETAAEVD